MSSTVRLEAEAARRHSPAFAWPTLVLAVVLLAGLVASTWAAAAGAMPLWLGAAINAAILYAIYTPLHDAIHGAIVPRRKGWGWVHTAVGMASAAPIWMFYHHHRKSHFRHHARTNFADDPDLYAKGSFARVCFVKMPWMLINYFNPFALLADCRRHRLTASETAITMALFALQAALVVAVVAAGYGLEFVVLWLLPWFVGNHVMMMAFAWMPHHDHSETGRYRDTRIALFPLGDLLLLQQNLHLIHHMLPAVPFYRYRAVFEEIRPCLEQNGARIEGFWPHAPAGGTPQAQAA